MANISSGYWTWGRLLVSFDFWQIGAGFLRSVWFSLTQSNLVYGLHISVGNGPSISPSPVIMDTLLNTIIIITTIKITTIMTSIKVMLSRSVREAASSISVNYPQLSSCANLADSGSLLDLFKSESECCLINKWKWIIVDFDYPQLSSYACLADNGSLLDLFRSESKRIFSWKVKVNNQELEPDGQWQFNINVFF